VSPSTLTERPSRPFDLDGEVIEVRVRESDQARTTRIIVGPRRPLEIIVPRGTQDAKIDSFLASKRTWIAGKVAASRAIAARPAQLGLNRPGVVWLAGEPLPVEPVPGGRAVAELSEGKVLVHGADDAMPATLERWYRREARRRILAVAEQQAARLGLKFKSVAIRDPKTRWGSCSSRGNLSFSWRLLVAPSEVLEYVVLHELLHLREPNHTKAFWRLVEAARPGWQEQARWLKEHGQELHEYRTSAAVADLE
jgi:predicted metal-dependent hydrolase